MEGYQLLQASPAAGEGPPARARSRASLGCCAGSPDSWAVLSLLHSPPRLPSWPAGEYLCPICRRLGNCLLPAVADAQPPEAVSAERQAQQVLSAEQALQRLEQLLEPGAANWATAPATADAQLQQRYRELQQRVQQQQGLEGLAPADALDLLPWYGGQGPGVLVLADCARHLQGKWLAQQQRVLDWLQRHGAGWVGGTGQSHGVHV